jgi:hypothetical protein
MCEIYQEFELVILEFEKAFEMWAFEVVLKVTVPQDGTTH